jgi:hypothetical protein
MSHHNSALDDMTEKILYKLKENAVSNLEPAFDQEIGYIYPDLPGLDLHDQLKVLHHLEKEGFVTSELLESLLECPECESTRFSIQLSCTVCKSHNITRGAVIEHMACGNIDFDSKYVSENSEVLACPKCGKRLKAIGVDYARPRLSYRCLNCKALLPETEKSYSCLKCTRTWGEVDLKELNLSKYTVDLDKASSRFAQISLLPLVVERLFSKHGVKAESSGRVKGLSKVEHTFDLLVSHYENGEPILAADLMLEDAKAASRMASLRILAFYAKCLDANFATSNVIKKVLVTQLELDGAANELALAYGIAVVKTVDPEYLTSFILRILAREPLQHNGS